ncbi:Hsp70 family protein [Sporosarcina sp. 179-K 3D1 HS]|uniref:Hsp70 family protein n=1 Tax=Sporosarcina sp. 179-K 3D1 HS TaxID=3232169 RepID=UPI0039A19EE2
MAIIGIDLGTTNSAMAMYKDGEAEIILNGNDQRTTASAFQLKPNGEEVIGSSAKKGAASMPRHTVLEVKRKMGGEEEVQVGARTYKPEEISSKILRYLKKSAEEKLGEPVTEAVITVPAYFTDAQRKSTKIAGELAGLRVERIINEPTAAALAFCHDNLDEDQFILVYDLGGGTFDVSLVELFDGVIEVKSSTGDNFLGGTDFDETIIKLIKDKFLKANGFPMEEAAQDANMLYYMLKEAAENAKIELSTQVETDISLPFIGLKDNLPVSFIGQLTRIEFENAIREKVESTIIKINETLEEAAISKDQVSEILMVGGSTRIPLVRGYVEKAFGKKVRTDINPDEVVATGAAVQAALKSGEIDSAVGLVAIDVCPYTLGIEIVNKVNNQIIPGYFDPIIRKNSAIPVTERKTYNTVSDNQTSVNVKVYQGEGRFVSENQLVSDELHVEGIPPNAAGQEEVEISFSYDINGIIQISAVIVSTGHKVTQVIQSQQGVMSAKEKRRSMERMEQEGLDADLYEGMKKAIHNAEKMMDDCSPEDRTRIERILADIETAVAAEDNAALRKLDEQLLDLLIELV